MTAKDKVTDEEQRVFEKVMAEARIQVDLYDELPDAIHTNDLLMILVIYLFNKA